MTGTESRQRAGHGGPRMIPRWSGPDTGGEPAWDRYEEPLTGLAVPAPDDLVAAYAKVMSALSAEREIVTGLVPAGGGAPGVLRLTVPGGTWRELAGVVAACGLETGPDWTEHCGDSVLDLSGLDDGADAADRRPPSASAAIWWLRVIARGGGLVLRADFRRDLLDVAHAARITGYYRTALARIADRPREPHDRHTLLPDSEIRLQVHGLAGPAAPPPADTFTELFRRQAHDRPDTVAARHGDRALTYRELDAAAGRVAAALTRAGVAREDVVAVLMDRHLDWLAAILGVLRAGGVYLPIRPDFPAERIAAQIRRSRCRFALADAAGAPALERARARLDAPCELVAPHDDDPAAEPASVRPGDLAYIYFTSGSTGEPKGAMCEHAGLVNHLFAKIDDHGVRPGDLVAQTASQCFDISLWQAIAPLAVGAATDIVDTATLLDPARFAAGLGARGTTVLQLVPSYVDTLLTLVEHHPVALSTVRTVSVTGEALKYDLVRRWFACFPDITLVNAYGATEVSDDTMHEVLSGPPERGFVTVGRSLRNVRTYILDDRLRAAPLGAPGEIAFAGVCVGRGYINDPERTEQAFTADPYVPGARMYRTGDFGRWLPEGKIEYLGRRDEQVKVRGYRIEIGEIENRLLEVAGVREATVVVDAGATSAANLVAFYAAGPEIDAAVLVDRLSDSLPDYMLPTYFHRLDRLPLNENGKVDKRSLTGLAATLGHADAPYAAPRTEAEVSLATAWAEVLGVSLERIGRDDDFFALGGTSLAAVRLVVNLDRRVSLQQISERPVLHELAALMDGATAAPPPVHGRLLQRLAGAEPPAMTLVCFPYAGGNAINFQAIARELHDGGSGIEVYGVELPGHDFTGGSPAAAGVDEVARIVRDELGAPGRPILLWGHGTGAAFALGTARLLEEAGHDLRRVFLGAPPRPDVSALEAEAAAIGEDEDRAIVARLRDASAFVMLDHLNPERTALVGAAVRHDVRAAHGHLAAALRASDAHRLRAPIDVVTDEEGADVAAWSALTAHPARPHTVAGGGPYFVRARADDVARIVRAVHDEIAAS